ncbi:MAG: NAD(P)-binding protein, partial [Sphingomonas sp.]|nr:NAD(P)-binding protein [Sphingomonas sp.]
MRRFAAHQRVIFWEEPTYQEIADPRLDLRACEATGVVVATPLIPAGTSAVDETVMLRALLDGLLAREVGPLIRWYYTPMMLPFSEHADAVCVVYDCMDELANFKDAPANLVSLEARLIDDADLVFTGGHSLFEAKRHLHSDIHPFPSSVEVAHFATAREPGEEPADQAGLPFPRLGFYGVVDERMDLDLLAYVADARPDWSIVIVGPVVKIGEDELPRRANLHYLGGKSYDALPAYLRGWDVALMPFAINEATRFISPTKTPEYLAAGCPVVSTEVTDVVRHYGGLEAVGIADSPDAFVDACDVALLLAQRPGTWRPAVDAMLAALSWDRTADQMQALMDAAHARNTAVQPIVSPTVWPSVRPNAYDVMVVGAGFAGSVMAERLAAGSNKRVLVVDRRPHIAGNAYDRRDAAGLLIHQYGPHIFHTNSQDIVDYLSRFTAWRPYE